MGRNATMAAAHRFDPQQARIASMAEDAAASFQAASVAFTAKPPC
jgi:hypothetical protein